MSIRTIFRGVFLALISALILSGILGILTRFTELPESELINEGIFVLSVFVGAIAAARIQGSKGLYNGLAVAVGVLLMMLTITGIMLPGSFSWYGIIQKTCFALIAGAAGGTFGVALK